MKGLAFVAYAAGIAMAMMTTADAPLFLAIGVPGAFLLLPEMRSRQGFPYWIVLFVAGAMGFFCLSSGPTVVASGYFFAFSILAGLGFLVQGRCQPTLVTPLIGLAVFGMLVAYFSSGIGGAHTMLHWLISHGFSEDRAHGITIAFRKTIHFTFYGSVGWTSLFAARGASDNRPAVVRTALLSALALASFDEVRQSSYSERTGSAWDVLLDLAGAVVFVGLSEWRRAKTR